MFTVIPCRNLFPNLTMLDTHHSLPHKDPPLSSFLSLRCIFPSKISATQQSFTISYLTGSCGLTPETAITASENVQFETPERPNSVLSLLGDYGFSKTHISKLVKKRPSLLLAKPDQTLLPKLEFFRSIGVSDSDLARTLSSDPTLLTRSLQNQIIPAYNLIRSVVGSDDKVVAAMKRTSWVLQEACSKNLVPNIEVLRELGVPEQSITLLLTHFPEAVVRKHTHFCDLVEEVKGMGFNPMKSTFVLAIHAISGKGKKLIWDRCFKVYRRWGWSENDILLAFRMHPHCMLLSEKKITGGMDFLVNKMGWTPEAIAKCPVVLFLSLEKRIIPRCLVIQVLFLKGLVKKDLSVGSVLLPVEKVFLGRFVTKYVEQVPELLSVYKRKLDVREV